MDSKMKEEINKQFKETIRLTTNEVIEYDMSAVCFQDKKQTYVISRVVLISGIDNNEKYWRTIKISHPESTEGSWVSSSGFCNNFGDANKEFNSILGEVARESAVHEHSPSNGLLYRVKFFRWNHD